MDQLPMKIKIDDYLKNHINQSLLHNVASHFDDV